MIMMKMEKALEMLNKLKQAVKILIMLEKTFTNVEHVEEKVFTVTWNIKSLGTF